ncbi:MAG TPA: HEXXH motif domain-containing protein [Streptosporangiaceae bacterium]
MDELMTPGIPATMFAALAAGGGGPEAVRALAAARYRKLALMLWGVRRTALREGIEADNARLAVAGYDLLAAVQREQPEVAKAAIMYPSVGAWALRVLNSPDSDTAQPGADPGRLSTVGAAAAVHAGLSTEIEVPVTGAAVMLPSLGAAGADGHTAMVRIADGHAEIVSAGRRTPVPADSHHDAPGWEGLHRVRVGSLDVLIDDLDPFRMPSSSELAPRLSAAERGKLIAVLQRAWPVLDAHHTEVAAEVREAVKVIVPLITTPGGLISSSTSATFGAVGLSEPPDPYACAVTLAHEVQHLKLTALLDTVSLTMPDDGSMYYAPWRDDPRPIGGLLQGAYAFLGVAGFWGRQRRHANGALRMQANVEFARWRAAAVRAVRTLLSSGKLTAPGQEFVTGMAHTLDMWESEPVPREALDLARDEAERHLRRWQAAYGSLPA